MSNTQTFIAHIRDLLAKDDVQSAIQQLSALLKDSPLLDEAVQQSARYNNVMQQIRLGLVDFASANIAQNQIRHGILELLREVEEQEVKTPDIKAEVERFAVKIEKNVVKNSTITAGGNVIIGDIIQYGDRKIPRFLTQKPFYTDFFIGRDSDLAAIETEYQDNNHLLVLVNGQGGMGKTTLAAQYWFRHEARYTHLAWVFSDRGIGNALISLSGSLGVQFSPDDKEADQIIRMTEAINNLDVPCLLVFDNANDAKDLEKYFVTLRRLSNCQVLLTSRVTKVADAHVHRVLPLSHPDAVRIFKKHYPKHTDTEDILLDKLLTAVGSNTLVIELLAKNLAMFNDFDTTYRLETLVSDLQDKGLFALQNEIVDVVYQSDALRKETPENIIAAMYDLSALPDDEKQILSNFALLPAENIPFQRLKDLLKPTDSPNFKNTLRALQQKGWIDYFETTGDFKISPVIQQITKLKNKTTLLDDGKTLINTLIDELQRDNIHKDNYTFSAIFSRYAETVVAAFEEPNYNAALLCERTGTYYFTIGNLDSAIAFYEKYQKISEQLLGKDPANETYKNYLATAICWLGIIHTSLGNSDKALGFYEEYNQLEKELYAAKPNNVDFKNGLALSYAKLGETHTSLGNLDKALGFYEDAYSMTRELYAANPNNVDFKNGLAGSYSKLGKMHTDLGNLDKTLGFYEEQNKLFEELYAANPNNVEFKKGLAVSYQNLGKIHTSLGNLNKVLGFYEDYNRLVKELYAANPNNVEFKNGLAISYQYLGITHTSLGNLDKALGFYEEYNRLAAALYAANPNNVAFKNGLAGSYSKLGEMHTDLGNLDKTLGFYEEQNKLFEELYAANPNNVEFKKGLAVSYQNLGKIHTSLGNLNKVLGFYEDYNRLVKELYAANPNNVDYKNGLAISYQYLGITHTSLGNLDQALGFYEEYNRLEKELYATNPNNVEFKNLLSISYSKLGNTHTSLGNLDKALGFYEEYNRLAAALYAANPNNVEFKFNYASSLKILGQIIFRTKGLKKGKPYFEQAYKIFSDLYSNTPIPSYFQEMKQLELMLTMNSGCILMITKIIMVFMKIPFIKRKIENLQKSAIDYISKEYKTSQRNNQT